MLSVVVLTKNEEKRIAKTLDSVQWADEIIVVDDESTDRTRDIVGTYTERIFVRKMDVEGTHRNWAYAQAKNIWVLSIDADEVVTDELRKEITALLSGSPQENGFTVPRRNYIGNYWVKHGDGILAWQLKPSRKQIPL